MTEEALWSPPVGARSTQLGRMPRCSRPQQLLLEPASAAAGEVLQLDLAILTLEAQLQP